MHILMLISARRPDTKQHRADDVNEKIESK